MTGVQTCALPIFANTIELIGFSNEAARRFASDNADTFRGSVKYDNEGVLHYKMIIPIEKIPVRNSREGEGAMPFTFGVEYGPFPSMDTRKSQVPAQQSSVPQSGGSRGGSGGRRGSGIDSDSQRSAASASRPAFTEVLVWIKNIKLATDK